MNRIQKITNDLDRVIATLKFRKLHKMETLMLVEEIEQLRRELKEADTIVAELMPKEDGDAGPGDAGGDPEPGDGAAAGAQAPQSLPADQIESAAGGTGLPVTGSE
jgi:hypothetical protein